MNRGELKVLVATWLDDLNYGYFTESQIETWLNNALREGQKILVEASENYYVLCAQTAIVQYQSEYDLPESFMKTHRLIYTPNPQAITPDVYPVLPITTNQQDLLTSQTGQPVAFYLKKNKLVLVPKPDVTGYLQLWYTYRVAEMTNDSDVPDFPEEYHEYLAVLAAIDGRLKDDRNIDALTEKRKRYEDMFKKVSEERTEDFPRMIVRTSWDGPGDFY